MDRPFVSCVMATGNRPDFLRQAIRCFLRRTYVEAELIVIDSGSEPVEHLCAGVPSVRYLRTSPETSLAKRLNLGIEHARGTVIQKMDDDDYYHPAFLQQAVETLVHSGGANAIVAWDCFYVVLKGEEELRFSGHGWTAGGTLCFARELWEQTRFRGGAPCDHFFIEDTGKNVRRVCAPERYLIVRHGGNMWNDLGGNDVDAYFRSLPGCGLKVSDLVERADLDFYAALSL